MTKTALITGIKICLCCNGEFHRRKGEALEDWESRKFCSHKCYTSYNAGENHYNYKNGTKRRPDGYLRFSDDTYVHRWVMEAWLCRPLEDWEFVHHIDEDKTNNAIENLEILTNSEHRKLHSKTQNRASNGRYI